MTLLTPIPPKTPLPQRIFYNIPVIGWIARDVMFGDSDNVIWAAIAVSALWLFSVAIWGVALLLVPFVLAIPAAGYGVFAFLVWRQERAAARDADEGQPDG